MTLLNPPDVTGVLPIEKIAHLSGLEALRGMIAGELPAPPISAAMNFWLSEADEGRAVFTGLALPDYRNPLGTIHGGWTSTLLDSAMACAVHSLIKPGQSYTTVSMTVQMVRALQGDGQRVTCEGKIVHMGNRVATSEGWLRDAKGRIIAHGTETCVIFDVPKEMPTQNRPA
ncbi:MAG: PaaI family thioesterase [Beijerinckiaceae bacterium]